MTSQQTSRFTKKAIKELNTREAGVTLLLSILVLSAIVAISLSFASIVLIEIRSSGDVARTEPAFYAVQGVVEETIFKVKRQVPPFGTNPDTSYNFDFGTSCTDLKNIDAVGINVSTVNSVSLKSGICSINPKADVTDIVPPTAGSTDNEKAANTKNIYNLYDPNNPYTNTQTISGQPHDSSYSRIEFYYKNNPGGNMRLFFCEASKNCFTDGWNYAHDLSAASGTTCIEFWDHVNPATVTSGCLDGGTIAKNKAYQFFLVNTSTTSNAGVEIKSWGPDPLNNSSNPDFIDPNGKGLPVFGQYAVNVSATSLGLTRKYLVNIPSN